jgi:hypothetical protein
LYLINIIGGGFVTGYVTSTLVVSGDAVATARNLLAHELLYRIGLAVHLIVLLTNIPLAMLFYDLFQIVHRRLARLMVGFLLVGTAVEGAYLLSQFVPLLLVAGERSVSALTADQLQAQVTVPFELASAGYSMVQVIYAGYLLVAGYLILRSTFLPRIVGALVAIGGVCYVIYSFAYLLSPEFAALLVPYIQIPSGLGEGSLCVVLLILGVNVARWQERANATGVALP